MEIIKELVDFVEEEWREKAITEELRDIERAIKIEEEHRTAVENKIAEREQKINRYIRKPVDNILRFLVVAILICFGMFLIIVIINPLIIENSQLVRDSRAYLQNLKNNAYGTMSCGNITHETCGSIKPTYCDNGVLENRADICGCIEGLRPYY